MKALTFLAKRFVAGETADKAIAAVRELNEQSLRASLDILGENVGTEAEARAAGQAYLDLLEAIARTGVDSNVSLKLTQMGLDVSRELCLEIVDGIVSRAGELGNFVRIDMEGTEHTDRTLDVFHALFPDHPNLGIVIQAYLHRTADDVERLASLKAPVRLCKGAYQEPATMAIRRMDDIRANYRRLAQRLVDGGSPLAFATHDESLISWAEDWIARENLTSEQLEFQMLYGLRRGRARQLAAAGHPMRAYVPFGSQWLPYFTRRLRERKENVFFVLKSLIAD